MNSLLSRRFVVLLILAAWLVTACSDAPPEAATSPEDELAELLTPLMVVTIHDNGEAIELFADGAARFDLDEPFRQVAWLMDADDASQLAYRIPDGHDSWSAWRDVEITWNEGIMYAALIRLDEPVQSVEIRGGEQILTAQMKFHEHVLAPDADGNPPALLREKYAAIEAQYADFDDDRRVTQQAIAPSSMVISRSEWGAINPGKICGSPHNPVRMAIHHTAIPASDGGDPAARMRGMQQAHLNIGWCDIGYHFVVSQDGRIFQGRSRSTRTGAHSYNYNANNIGISLIGNYNAAVPPQGQLEAAATIMNWVHETHGVALNTNAVKGHGQQPYQSTSCPGTHVLNRLDDLIAMAQSGAPSEPAPPPPPPGGCIPSADDDATGSLFADYRITATGYDDAVRLLDAGITQGCSADPLMFCPNCELTRSQMAVFLVRAAGLDTSNPPSQATFDDVPTSSAIFPYVETAAAAGITSGCGNNNFCPGDNITRAQAAAMIQGAQNWPDEVPADAPSFDDVSPQNTHYAAVETMKQRCVTSGCGDGTNFCPGDELTRGQAAAFVGRAFNLENSNPCAAPGGCSPHAAFGTENSQFVDYPTDKFGYDEATLLFDEGITQGCAEIDGGVAFCPDCPTHRRAMVMFLVRALELDTSNPPATPTFDDVQPGTTGYAEVEAAYAAGITSGCGNGKFCPDDLVTRAQVATMIHRGLGWPDASGSPTFADVPDSSAHFDGVEALADRCVTSGCGDGTNFCPNGRVSRAHLALFIARAFNLDGINPCAASGGGGDAPSTDPDGSTNGDSGPDPGECADVDPDFATGECADDDQWVGDGHGEDDDETNDGADDDGSGDGDGSGESSLSGDGQSSSGCATTAGGPALPALIFLATLLVVMTRRRDLADW